MKFHTNTITTAVLLLVLCATGVQAGVSTEKYFDPMTDKTTHWVFASSKERGDFPFSNKRAYAQYYCEAGEYGIRFYFPEIMVSPTALELRFDSDKAVKYSGYGTISGSTSNRSIYLNNVDLKEQVLDGLAKSNRVVVRGYDFNHSSERPYIINLAGFTTAHNRAAAKGGCPTVATINEKRAKELVELKRLQAEIEREWAAEREIQKQQAAKYVAGAQRPGDPMVRFTWKEWSRIPEKMQEIIRIEYPVRIVDHHGAEPAAVVAVVPVVPVAPEKSNRFGDDYDF